MDIFNKYLLNDEKILWSGQPLKGVLFTGSDIFIIPFSILATVLVGFWGSSIFNYGLHMSNQVTDSQQFFWFLFALFTLYFLFGRFLYKVWKKGITYYAVTNMRIFILVNTKSNENNLETEYIENIVRIDKSIRPDGIGTIKFGEEFFVRSMYENTGLDYFGSFYGKAVPTFYDIPDALNVYKLVKDIKSSQ